MGIFNLIPIMFDDQQIECRPTQWSDEEFNDPVEYMTTCPKCGQLVTFHIKEIINDHFFCKICDFGISSYNNEKLKAMELEDDQEIQELHKMIEEHKDIELNKEEIKEIQKELTFDQKIIKFLLETRDYLNEYY